MAKTKEQKKQDVEKLIQNIDKGKSMVFVAYEGLKAPDMFELRKRLRNAGCKIVVTKKTLLEIVLKQKKIDFDIKSLAGQIGLVFAFEDEISGPKISYNFSKENDNLKILAGYFENKIVEAKDVIALAQIPSKHDLLAKVVASISSPASGFVSCLQGNIKNLVFALSAIKK